MVIKTDAELMKMTAAAIAKEYRAAVAWVRSQPEQFQYLYGAQLKRLQAAWQVALESR
jgi:predicted oxidoreductase